MDKGRTAVSALIALLCAVSAPAAPAPENTPDYFVEWVRSRGNLYVDTGVAGKVGVKAEMSFFHCTSSSAFPVMLGAWGEENERFNLVMHNYNQCRWEYGSWDGGTHSNPAATGMQSDGCSISTTTAYGAIRNVTVECRADGSMEAVLTSANNSSKTATMNSSGYYGLVDTEASLYLFAAHRKFGTTDLATQKAGGILRHCKLWTDYDGTGSWTLVRDFRPCVKNGRAGLYDAVNEEILYPAGGELESGPATLERGYALGANEHPATLWGRIGYGKDRSDMDNAMWMHLAPTNYVAKGAGDTTKLNGANNSWQGDNLKRSQLRYDGWFYVSADKAGDWTVKQMFDDYFAIFIDGENVIRNNSYKTEYTGGASVSEGWHRFTIIAGDTYGGYGSCKDYYGQGWWPFGITVNGSSYVFSAANFPQGSGSNTVVLDADADWSDRGGLILDGGTVLDLNGHTLVVHDIASDGFVGACVTNSAAKVSALLFAGDPLSSKALQDGLVTALASKIVVANKDEQVAVWTGAANDGGNALNADNWADVLTGGPVVPTASHDVSIVGGAVNLQIPAGTAFACKSFDVLDCTFSADCDWSGLSVKPSISGTADLAGHVLSLATNLTANAGAALAGADGSELRIKVPDGAHTDLGEEECIDSISNLSLSGSAKIVLVKSDSGDISAGVLHLGKGQDAEFVQNGGKVALANGVSAIGATGSNGAKRGVWRMNGGTLTTSSNNGSEFQVGRTGVGEFIQTAGDVNIGNWFSIARSSGTGVYTITGGTLSATKAERPVWIAGDNGATGTLNVGGDASVRFWALRMGGDENKDANRNAYINVAGDGSLAVSSGGFQVGTFKNSHGTVAQSGGAVKCQSWLAIGRYANSTGLYSMSGGVLEVSGSASGLAVGEEGTGTLEVGGSAVVTASVVSVSHRSGGIGTLRLKEGGTIVTPLIRKGGGSSAKVILDGGTVKAAADGQLIKDVGDLRFGKAVEFDTDGHDVSFANNTVSSGYGPGSLVKSGSGTLSLGSLACAGKVDVRGGTLAMTADCDNSIAATLAHRWSFTSDLTDSVTGEAGAKYGSAAAVFENGAVKLAGGAKGNCYVDLGANKLPGDNATIEMWLTLREIKEWGRCFVLGGANGIVFNSRRSNNEGYTCNFDSCGTNQNAGRVLERDKQYYIAISFKADGNGGVTVRQYLKEAGANNFLWTNTYTKENWSLSAKVNPTQFWLAHSTDSTGDLKADYDEVRVWDGVLTANQIAFSSSVGPDAEFGIFNVASGATLDLGGHTLVQPVVKGSGTIATGAGGELVVSDRLVAKAGECIEASGTIDLTNAKIEIDDPENISAPFTFLKPAAGGTLTIVGSPEAANLPGQWKLSMSADGTCIIKPRGFAVFVR